MSENFGQSRKASISIKVVSVKIYAEKERERVKQLRVEDPAWWGDPSRSKWAREQFGKNLTEKNGLYYDSREPVTYVCDICGHVLTHRYGKFFYLEYLDKLDDHESFEADICRRCMLPFGRGLVAAVKEVKL